ncbi:hypothetical protein SAMN02745108_02377 [Fibrobacter intestinalis]|uniref:Uncharacterized protein n=1 Tax=Fibrobacter intestinalis TaxID=28122 RepID=A0A1T4QR21_9BACT|nr:hypothetical protein BGW94_0937 [Fibrobacter sp. NR9]SKA06134.1 hypothetical protein SAMN02745108_02377 [Fibrobacter intestinalis]
MNPTRIFESLLTPVKKFPTSFFFLSFILWLPEIFAVDTIHLLKNIVRGGGGQLFLLYGMAIPVLPSCLRPWPEK